MKYWILGLSLMVMACSHSVDVKDQASYKCGDQIIRVTVLNDNSMIVRANGIDHVLTKVASPAGEKYEDAVSQVSFTKQDGEFYLGMQGRNYPLCLKIKQSFQLLYFLFPDRFVGKRTGDAMPEMLLQNIAFHRLDSRTHRPQLAEDIGTIAPVFDHFFYAFDLPGNAI